MNDLEEIRDHVKKWGWTDSIRPWSKSDRNLLSAITTLLTLMDRHKYAEKAIEKRTKFEIAAEIPEPDIDFTQEPGTPERYIKEPDK